MLSQAKVLSIQNWAPVWKQQCSPYPPSSTELFFWAEIIEVAKRTSENQSGQSGFFCAGWRFASRVRNTMKYWIREFASSFSTLKMRGEFDVAKRMVMDSRPSGNVKRDELLRQEFSAFLPASPLRTSSSSRRYAIFVLQCKSFYNVSISTLFPKLGTNRIFPFSRRAQTSARLPRILKSPLSAMLCPEKLFSFHRAERAIFLFNVSKQFC